MAAQAMMKDATSKGLLTTLTAMLAGALALAANSNWPLALLITAIVLSIGLNWYMVERRFRDQDVKMKACEDAHRACEEKFARFIARFIDLKYEGPLRRDSDKKVLDALKSADLELKAVQ